MDSPTPPTRPGPSRPTDPEMAVYSACDGRRPPWEVGDASILHSLVDRGIVQWDLRVPLGPNPERDLRARLEQIGDDDVRFRALATLEQLESGRDTVARAAGDAVSLGRALDELDATFVRVTGREPQRAAGVTYGARSVCYEDCRRHLDLRIGDALRTGPRPSELGSASHVQEDPDRAPRRDHRRLCVC